MIPKHFFTERKVQKLTQLSYSALRNARTLKRGIPFYKFGRLVRYHEKDVNEYLERMELGDRVETRKTY